MTSPSPIQVTFTVTGLTNANVDIIISPGEGAFSFGDPSQPQFNGFSVAPAGGAQSAQFGQLFLTSNMMTIQGNATGGTTSIVVGLWINPTGAQVSGTVELPGGVTFTPHGPHNQSGSQSGSGGWFVS